MAQFTSRQAPEICDTARSGLVCPKAFKTMHNTWVFVTREVLLIRHATSLHPGLVVPLGESFEKNTSLSKRMISFFVAGFNPRIPHLCNRGLEFYSHSSLNLWGDHHPPISQRRARGVSCFLRLQETMLNEARGGSARV